MNGEDSCDEKLELESTRTERERCERCHFSTFSAASEKRCVSDELMGKWYKKRRKSLLAA